MNSIQNLRAALLAELQAPELDSDRLSALAAALAGSDASRVRFSVDAGMLARLGRELMARHETALSELIKNAYDADARTVVVRIAGKTHGDYIEISDDGTGMSQDALVNGFMRLATNDKVEHPVSTKFKRRRAGQKGVGRFAAERLGKSLVLTTATRDADHALQMEIDWERFAPGLDLASVSIPINVIKKARPEGTTLRIERLRDTWPEAAIERTFEHVAELIDLGDQTKPGAASGASFVVRFSANGKDHKVFDIRTQVANQAYATIECTVDESGLATWGLRCPNLNIDFAGRPLRLGEGESNQLEYARHAKMAASYYLLERRYFPPTVFKTVQNYLARNGGLRLYRNGFRVIPYGEEGDDWLGLDLLSSQRSRTLAPVRNRNFLGTVSLVDDVGLFEETSSREGLIDSLAFQELVDTMHSAIVSGVREIDAVRTQLDLKRTRPSRAPDPVKESDQERVPSSKIARELTTAVREVQTEIQSHPQLSQSVATALQRVVTSAEEVSKRASESDALLKEIDLLRVLASMGLAIGQFTHEFSTLSGAMRASLAIMLETDRSQTERIEAAAAVRALLDQARDFTGLFKSMTEENALRDRLSIDLYEVATSFRSAVRTILQRNGVTMEVEDDGDEIQSPPMHRSELFAILLNFTTNSIKAIKRAGRSGRILVRLGARPDGGARIEFSDNGDGIADEVRANLFEPFVTTTAARGAFAQDDDTAVGSGLGLAIVRDIVVGAGGTVTIGDAPRTYATSMVVDLPGAKI